MPQSLRIRALAANLTLAGISVIVLTVLFLLAERAALQKQLELRAHTLAQFVASQSEFAMLVGNRPELNGAPWAGENLHAPARRSGATLCPGYGAGAGPRAR